MTLQFEVESLDNVSEEHKGLYKEHGNKFRLAVEGVEAPEDVQGLKSALQQEREAVREATQLAGQYKRTGLTPEEIAEIKAQRDADEQKKLEEKGNFEAILKQHQEQWEAERSELTGQVTQANDAVIRHVVRGSIVAALAQAGATDEGLKLLPDKFADRIEADLSGDMPKLKILAEDGKTPKAGKGEGGLATLDEFVADIAKEFPNSFKSEAKGGGGRPPNAGGGGTHAGKKFNEMNGAELSSLRKENPQEYERLKSEFYG